MGKSLKSVFEKSESDHQIELFEWARNPFILKKYPMLDLMFAINNGLKLSIGQAVKAKRMGTNKGIPDTFLPFAKPSNDKAPSCAGLFIEMKKKGGKLSPEQKEKIKKLSFYGYKCVVCYSAKEAIDAIEDYLKNEV